MKALKSPKNISTAHIPDHILDEVEKSDLNRYSMYLFATLLTYADSSRKCWPSMDLLCIDNKCSKTTLSKRISELETKGYIKVERVPRKNNVYTLLKIPKTLRDKTIITRDFIKSDLYTIDEKILVISSINNMKSSEICEEGSAVLMTTISKLCKRCGMSWKLANKTIQSLENKNVVSSIDDGFIFSLDTIGQSVIYLNVTVVSFITPMILIA